MRRGGIVGGLLAAAMLACLGVGRAGAAEELVRVGSVGGASDAGIFIAQEKGYFAQEGLRVEHIPFTSASQVVAPMGTGQLEVGGGTMAASLINAVMRGVPVLIVADKGQAAPGFGFTPLLVRSDLAGVLRRPEDFRGRRVALNSRGHNMEVELAEFLRQGHLTLADIQLQIIGFPDMAAAFANKAIDAAIVLEPFATQIRKRGLAVILQTSDQFYPNHQTAVIMYSPAFVRQRPEAARRWMVAYLRGVRDYYDAFVRNIPEKRRDVVAVLTKRTPVTDPSLYDEMIMPYLDPNGVLNVESIRKDIEYHFSAGHIQQIPDLSRLIDDSFRQAAVQRLGRYP